MTPPRRTGRPGRPSQCPDDILCQVLIMRKSGRSLRAISDALNAAGLQTPAGSQRWWHSHVDRLLRTRAAVDMAAELWPSREPVLEP
jgi:hypothetical protein